MRTTALFCSRRGGADFVAPLQSGARRERLKKSRRPDTVVRADESAGNNGLRWTDRQLEMSVKSRPARSVLCSLRFSFFPCFFSFFSSFHLFPLFLFSAFVLSLSSFFFLFFCFLIFLRPFTCSYFSSPRCRIFSALVDVTADRCCRCRVNSRISLSLLPDCRGRGLHRMAFIKA